MANTCPRSVFCRLTTRESAGPAVPRPRGRVIVVRRPQQSAEARAVGTHDVDIRSEALVGEGEEQPPPGRRPDRRKTRADPARLPASRSDRPQLAPPEFAVLALEHDRVPGGGPMRLRVPHGSMRQAVAMVAVDADDLDVEVEGATAGRLAVEHEPPRVGREVPAL